MDACVIDGEAVCFGENCFDFHALRSKAGGKVAALIAFDALVIDGEDLRARPLRHAAPAWNTCSRSRLMGCCTPRP